MQTKGEMIARMIALVSAVLIAGLLLFSMASPRADDENGIVRVKSAYPLAETVNRLKKDVADKSTMFFSEIDQSELAAKAGIKLLPSTLLVFGNPSMAAAQSAGRLPQNTEEGFHLNHLTSRARHCVE